jgi:1,2-phenylacetyl-CoA epoxidase PaaB subunit
MQNDKATLDEGEDYEVFARLRVTEPMQHVGSVKAPNRDLATSRAHFLFRPHRKWLEMCIVPESAIIALGEEPNVRKMEAV